MPELQTDEIANAARYERSGRRKAYRDRHYERSLTAKAGKLELKVPKLKGALFESAVIERGLKGVKLVAGGFPDGNSALMLVCARIRYVTANEWESATISTCPGSMTPPWKRTNHRAVDGHDSKCATRRGCLFAVF